MTMTMRRPAAAALLLALLVGVGCLLLLLHVQVQAASSLATKATSTRQQQRRRLGLGGGGAGLGAEEKARLGSRPPSCRGKCNECSPCTAVQVPTLALLPSTTVLRLSNYKPMGWKCQCHNRLYQP